MKETEINAIKLEAASMSDQELENKYYEAVYDSLGSQVEDMIEHDYNPRDIEERRNYEQFLCEKSSILEMLCIERKIKLWEN